MILIEVIKLDLKNPDLIWQLFFVRYLPYVFLTPISSMLFYQSIQPKKIGTSVDSEKRGKFLNLNSNLMASNYKENKLRKLNC